MSGFFLARGLPPSQHVQANFYTTGSSIAVPIASTGSWTTPTSVIMTTSLAIGFNQLTGSQINQYQFTGITTDRHFLVTFNVNVEMQNNVTRPLGLAIQLNGNILTGSIFAGLISKATNGSNMLSTTITTPLSQNDILCPVITNFQDTQTIGIYSMQYMIAGQF